MCHVEDHACDLSPGCLNTAALFQFSQCVVIPSVCVYYRDHVYTASYHQCVYELFI